MNKVIFVMVFMVLIPVVTAQGEINLTEEALNAISRAESDIKYLEELGFGTSFFNDVLADAKDTFDDGDYNLVLDKIQEIDGREERAYDISDSLAELGILIRELGERGLESTEVRNLFRLANSAFLNELFDDAEILIFKVNREIDDMVASATAVNVIVESASDNILTFVEENWQYLLVIGIVFFNSWEYCFLYNEDMEIEK